MAHQLYKFEGEHIYDGMTMAKIFPPELLQRIQNSFCLRDDDILVMSYPKAGKCCLALDDI